MGVGPRLVTAGRVGRTHGLDGSFTVLAPQIGFARGTPVTVAGSERTVEHRAGTDSRPIVRVSGIAVREAAAAVRGELLLVTEAVLPIEEREWLAEDLIGCELLGYGTVSRVIAAPSCDVLELDDGSLVPLISDAVRRVDVAARVIEADDRFLARMIRRGEG